MSGERPILLGISLASGRRWSVLVSAIMVGIPALLAKVRLRNRGDVYLVVDVNGSRKVAELMSITGVQHLIQEVPFAAIIELVEEAPDFLRDGSGDDGPFDEAA